MQRQNSSIYRDQTSFSLATPYSDSEKEIEDIDFTQPQNSDVYFNTLDKIQKNSKKVRLQETQQEQTLMEYLPVNERFSLNKEGKVLSRWQERQKDWEKIQANIAKRIGVPETKPLMMTTTDDYREKLEQFDLLQAAIPLEDRFSEPWQMTLRGGGPVRASVGHMFSGLECIFSMHPPKPKMTLKPKSVKFSGVKTSTFLEQSEAFNAKKTLYSKHIQDIRPHTIDGNAANSLVARSIDLFKWAKESSSEYYRELKLPALSAINEEDSLSLSERLDGERSTIDSSLAPKIEFITHREVVFQTRPGENSFRTVSFKNMGSVAISYVWKKNHPQPKEDSAGLLSGSSSGNIKPDPKKPVHLHDILASKGTDGGSLRKHLLRSARESFFCLKDVGVVLPSETLSTQFMFSSRAGDGVFNDSWMISFQPSDTIISFNANDSNSIASRSHSCLGSFIISLRGICCAPDVGVHKRENLSHFIEKCTADSMAFDIIQSCLKRVREAVRQSTLQQRQITHFRNLNATLLDSLSENFGSLSPLFITPDRLNQFAILFNKASKLYNKTKHMLNFLDAQLNSKEMCTAQRIEYGPFPVSAPAESPFFVGPYLLAATRAILFPEENIEIFDEINEEMLVATWNFKVETIIGGIVECVKDSYNVEKLEEALLKKMAADLKQRLRDERKAAKAAAAAAAKAAAELDPDYDSEDDIANAPEEEEEEEEEEEPEEEDEDKVKPKHPLLVESELLLYQVHNSLNLLSTRPISIDKVADAIREGLLQFLDSFDDFRAAAITTAELGSFTSAQLALPQLHSPFTTEEGAKKWSAIMHQKTIEDLQASVEKGKKPPPKAKPGTVVGPTPAQIDFFYHNFFHNVCNGMTTAMVAAFEKWDSGMYNSGVAALTELKISGDKLFDIAAVRDSDIKRAAPESGDDLGSSSTIAFLNFCGDAFTAGASARTLSVTGVTKKRKQAAVQPIIQLLEYAPKAIVLLYENSSTLEKSVTTDKASSLEISSKNVAEDIQKFITDQRLASIQLDEKRRLQELRKARKAMTRRQRKKSPKTLPPKAYKAIEFVVCNSCAELMYKMTSLLTSGSFTSVNASAAAADKFFGTTIPIFILENIKVPGVVPEDPVFVEEMSDDDEAPIPIGRSESASQKLHDWIKRSPHTLAVAVPTGEKKSVKVDCFCSGSAAVAEVIAKIIAFGNEYIWVEASAEKLFEVESFSAFQNVKVSHSALERIAADLQVISNRFVSEEVREAFLWSGVLHSLPRAPDFAASVEKDSENELVTSKLIGRHLLSIFPNTLQRGDKPKAVAVIGGSIRADKWRVLDQLVDLVDEIVLVGEMCLPFVALFGRVYLSKHEAVCMENRDVSLTLLQKARLRGVSLTLPVDLIQGDEQLQSSHWIKAFTNIPTDSRGEGTDYEGESKVIAIQDNRSIQDGTFEAQVAPVAVGDDTIKVDGYIYDIGPESCALLKQAISFADLLYIWGTVGVCEVAGFQNGQIALVEAANQLTAHAGLEAVLQSPAQLLPMAPPVKDPLRTLLLGDSTVEWFARIADSDGELGGDLPAAGLVTYCCRQSAIHSGLLGLYPANVVNGSGAGHPEGLLQYRTSTDNEWVYTRRVVEEEEEEDEDD